MTTSKPRILESDILDVRERNRIDDVVGERVRLEPFGDDLLKGLCPFCDPWSDDVTPPTSVDRSPAFNVRPTRGTFHCFRCGEGGDVITFVMKLKRSSFVEAVERLAKRSGSA